MAAGCGEVSEDSSLGHVHQCDTQVPPFQGTAPTVSDTERTYRDDVPTVRD